MDGCMHVWPVGCKWLLILDDLLDVCMTQSNPRWPRLDEHRIAGREWA